MILRNIETHQVVDYDRWEHGHTQELVRAPATLITNILFFLLTRFW